MDFSTKKAFTFHVYVLADPVGTHSFRNQGVSYRTIIAILFSDVRNLVKKQRPLTSLGIVLDKLARVKKGPTSRKFPTG